MKRPFFSCVVPVKGPRPYFATALKSLREQGLGDELEIIIQDADVEPDLGQSDALNKGFAKARGEWLFWLNADDVLLPGALARVRAIAETASVGWISGNLVYLNASGQVEKCAAERGRRWSYAGFPVRTYGPSSFFRRELLEEAGGVNPSLRFAMDTDLWCRFRRAGYWYVKIPEYLWGFRIHVDSQTSGDLCGQTPPGMEAECRQIDERYGISRHVSKVWKLRLIRLLDGSYWRAFQDTRRLRGKDWSEVR